MKIRRNRDAGESRRSSSFSRRSDNIKSVIIDKSAQSTVHGLSKIVKSDRTCLKVMWFIFLLLSFTFCLHFAISNVREYLKYDVVTRMTMETEIPTKFPETLEFATDVFKKNNMSTEWNGIYPKYLNNHLLRYYVYNQYLNMYVRNSPELSQEFILNLTTPIKDMLLSCIFNANECSSSDFYQVTDTFFGNCYKFNSDRNAQGELQPDKLVTRAGFLNGLQLELLIGEPSDNNLVGIFNGLHVMVNNRSVQPLFLPGMDIPTGSATSIAIKRLFIHKLHKPYSECVKDIKSYDSQYVKEMLTRDTDYRQSDCFVYCFQDMLIDKCKCHDMRQFGMNHSLRYPGVKTCTTFAECLCRFNEIRKFFSQDPKKLCDCPLECETIHYQLSRGSALFPTEIYYNKFLKNHSRVRESLGGGSEITYDKVRSRTLMLNIYYDDMTYAKLVEFEKFKFIDLTASIGGVFSLFLGASFLSLAEIADLVVTVWLSFRRRSLFQPQTA